MTTRLSKILSVSAALLFTFGTMPIASAFSVPFRDINNTDDVRELFDDVSNALDDEVQNLKDDCNRGASLDLSQEQDDLERDIERIYDREREDVSSSLENDLNDDEDQLKSDLEDSIRSLRNRGCDRSGTGFGGFSGGRSTRGNVGYGNFGFLPFSPFGSFGFPFSGLTTVTPILQGGFTNFNCFNGIGSIYPTQITQVQGYQNFNGNTCVPSPYYGGGMNWFGGFGY